MRVAAAGARSDATLTGLDFEIEVATARYGIWLRAPREHRLEASGDLELAMALAVAMAGDGTLNLDLPVSQQLLTQQETIQDTLLNWYPELRRAAIDARPDPVVPPVAAPGTLACFTGGVDSFFSVLSHPGELSGLLFVHGFDVPLDARA